MTAITRRSRYLFILTILGVNNASSSIKNTYNNKRARIGISYPCSKADEYVTSSPLSIAVVCSDGVAMVTFHTASSQEPLLYDPETIDEKNADMGSHSHSHNNSDSNNQSTARGWWSSSWKDLPMSTRGPLRIEPVDGFGSALLCNGWRTDGMALADKCRELTNENLEYDFSDSPPNFSNMEEENDIHSNLVEFGLFQKGRSVAHSLAQFLATCSFSNSVRGLSTVGLFATAGIPYTSTSATTHGGFLWLIDDTGAYRVRAHAVGRGATFLNPKLIALLSTSSSQSNHDNHNHDIHNHLENEQLEQHTPNMTVEQGIHHLLTCVWNTFGSDREQQLQNAETNDDENQKQTYDPNDHDQENIDSEWILGSDVRVELAAVDAKTGKLRRFRLSHMKSLFSSPTSSTSITANS
eukprot:CAMPEP_0184861090 /NCGR_PEP_ID=MMETSP0580-20130426/5860_1 /TAXON_ID=1118495 /ORGANISM="Dactyliosolen fragilissimus" /LENGTH=409 /DNA_ID=CAMNT_0027358459 /DNA_START=19 /DNA_END=1248 /DNA_ORIENTATION=+